MSSVAVIVICRNEEKHIRRCLDSLLANDYDRRLMTILVVDGMSTDGTRQIVAEYSQKHGFVRLVDNPRKVIPAALNTGIRVARETGAQVLLRADAHAVYAPNYISTLVRGLEQYGADNIGGIRETAAGNTPWEQAVAIVWGHPFAAANALFRTALGAKHPRPADVVWCGCFRMSVFDRIGGFNELMLRTEDREFHTRLRRSGGKIILDPSARCTYFPRTGLATYVRNILNNGFWVYYAQRFSKVPLILIRNLVPLGFVLWHLLAVLLGVLMPSFLPWMLAPIAAYWIVNLAVSARAAWKHRSLPIFPCLILLFAATHYLYGLGNLWGLIRATIQGKRLPRNGADTLPIILGKEE
jgi:glycosyltransferase involved in cell wall biosynthesis